jgi:predicted transposase/invertase (TIGR01784 family)
VATTPHDRLFKQIFAAPEDAAGLLRPLLPSALVASIDWQRMQRQRRSFVDAAAREHHTDLLFTATLRRSGKRRRILIYLLFEHKSQAERFTALQILGYLVAIWQDFRRRHPRARRLPPILPIVVHHDDRPFAAPLDLRGLIDVDGLAPEVAQAVLQLQPEFRILLDDLAAQSEAAIAERSLSAMARLALLLMQHARGGTDAKVGAALARWRDLLVELMATPRGQRQLVALSSYVMATTEVRPERLRDAVAEILDPAATHQIMFTADRLIAKGRRQGRREGRAEGRATGAHEGRIQMLTQQLEARFGALDASVRERIAASTGAELDAWGVRVLTAASVAEVFATPPQ